jgi:hypothetical protein
VDTVSLIFDPALHLFLKALPPGQPMLCPVDGTTTIKHIVESAGPPHTEVGAISVNGRFVNFDFVPSAGQTAAIGAIRAPFEVFCPTLLRPRPLDRLRFVVDVNVGKLAVLMRIVGLDTAYQPDRTDKDLAELAEAEHRIVLTKDRGLLKRRQIVFGRYVRAVQPDDQLKEVLAFFGIRGPVRLFSRCLCCNQRLLPVAKEEILDRLEPNTKRYFHRFNICPACRRIYWQGSHHDQMMQRLERTGITTAGSGFRCFAYENR